MVPSVGRDELEADTHTYPASQRSVGEVIPRRHENITHIRNKYHHYKILLNTTPYIHTVSFTATLHPDIMISM